MPHILFFQWNAFMQKGMENALNRMKIEYDTFYYVFKDWEKDDVFVDIFMRKLEEGGYSTVLSVNFSPLISQVCEMFNKNHMMKIKYISWVYDCPLHIRNLRPLKNECNKIYFFDRIQAEDYKKYGAKGVGYMPLAADADVFAEAFNKAASDDRSVNSVNVNSPYACDVSLVGKLYKSDYDYLLGPLDGYWRGFLEGIVESQKVLYGGYIIDEMLTQEVMQSLNKFYGKASDGKKIVEKRELEFALGCEVTGRERFMALALLQNRCNVHLYSTQNDERLTNVVNKGYADYYSLMPNVFRNSKINLNISLKLIKSGVPLRVFDVLACGGFLLTNYQPELMEYFEPGVDLVVYENIPDLISKVMYYLSHEDERIAIARNGYDKVRRLHTYDDRLKKMINS